MTESSHFSASQLETLVLGKLGEPEAAEVRLHLASCAACGQQYEECQANQASVDRLRHAVDDPWIDEPFAQIAKTEGIVV